MADGKITIKVTVDGKEIDIAAVSLGEMEGAAKGAGKETGRAGKDFEDAGKKAGKFDSGLGKVIKSLGLVAIGAAAFKVLTKYMGAAVDRFDKLQTFPKVLEQLGASSEDAERQMGRLSDGIEGLPTSLDEIAASAQQMYLIFRNADKATDSALALNNALLASGTAGGEASTGAEMYMKTLQKGKVTLLDWQNMTTRMGVAINEVADSMGLTIDQLKTGLMDGSISVNEFNDELIKLGTGTGKLAQVALTTSEGIRTSFQNLGTAVTKGLADIITGVDNLLRDVTGKGSAQHFDSLKHVIRAAFNAIKTIIEGLAPVIRFVADAFKFLVDAAKPLEPVLIGIAAAFVAYKVVTLYGLSIQKAATLTVSFIRNLITATTTTNLFAAAQAALQVVMQALQGPLGWITLGIGALAAAMAVVIKRVKASAQKFKEYRKEIKDINETLDNLRDGVEGTNRSYDDQKKAVEINIRANRDSIRSLNELMGVEEKSAGHKKLILEEVNQLNEAIPDLNLAYDEQRDRLNMSTDVMDKYLTVAQREEELNIVREKGIELEEKRAEAGTNLERLTEIHKELNEEIIEGSNYAQYQHIKALNESALAIQEAQEIEEMYKFSIIKNNEDIAASRGALAEASEAATEAEREAAKNLQFTYDELSDEMKGALDAMKGHLEKYREEATDIFKKMEIDTSLTFDDIMKNLEHNAKATSDFMTNLGELIEMGIDERFIDNIIALGPSKAAGAVQNILDEAKVKPSAIEEFNQEWRKAGETANQLIDVYEKAADPVSEEARNILTQQKKTMFEELSDNRFIEIGGVVVDQLGTGLTDPAKLRALTNKGTEVTDNLGRTVSDNVRVEDYAIIGGRVPSGMQVGIARNSYVALRAADRLASSVKTRVQAGLKIYSPSRVMEREVGRFIPEGIARGISRYGKTLFDEVEHIIDKLERMFGGIILPMPGLPSVPPIQLTTAEVAAGGPALGFAGAGMSRSSATIQGQSGAFGGTGATITGNQFIIREEADIYRIARELDNLIEQKKR